MVQYAPIAIFAFNRPKNLERLLHSLSNCPETSSSVVYIFVDGPRNVTEGKLVAAVREIARNFKAGSVHLRFAEENVGLRRSIFSGVSEVCSEHGNVIVLEDDLVLSPTALNFFNVALNKYSDNARVWSICGYLFDTAELRSHRECLFLPIGHSWGWATWWRAWQQFELDARPRERDLQSSTFRSMFDLAGYYPFTQMMKSSLKGYVSSWYAHWNYTIYINGGVSVFPPRRIVDNLGIGNGTHGSWLNPQRLLVSRPGLFSGELCFPNDICVDHWAVDAIRKSRELRVQRLIAHAGLGRRMLSRFLRRIFEMISRSKIAE